MYVYNNPWNLGFTHNEKATVPKGTVAFISKVEIW